MTAAIRTEAYSASQTARTAASRPQVQSRRVSLRLGPLGVAYATDEVLWTRREIAEALASSAPEGAAANETPLAGTVAGTFVPDAAWTDAGAPDFSRDLAAARRVRTAFERAARTAAETQTYRPARRRPAATVTDGTVADAAFAGTAPPEATASPESAARTLSSGTAGRSPAMRRAIAAYLLAASAGAQPGMIDAVV